LRCACIVAFFLAAASGVVAPAALGLLHEGAPLGQQPGRYGSGFLVQPVAVRSEGAVDLVFRVTRRREGCLRCPSRCVHSGKRAKLATTKPRTTRRGRPGSLHPSLYRLSRRARESNRTGLPKHTSLNALRGLASQTRGSTRGSKRSCPQALRRHPTPSPRQQPAKESSRAASSSITQGELPPAKDPR
jgi:hypothetical protein